MTLPKKVILGLVIVALAVGAWSMFGRRNTAPVPGPLDPTDDVPGPAPATFTWTKPGWIDNATSGPHMVDERADCEDLCVHSTDVPNCLAYTFGKPENGQGSCYLYDHVLSTPGGFRLAGDDFFGAGVRTDAV